MIGLAVDHERCTGCCLCELACSSRPGATGFNPSLSAIRVHVIGLMDMDVPLVCMQCEDAPCAGACPEEAFYRDAATGALLIDEGLCSGCGACVKACPYDAINEHATRSTPIKCDLCGGSPLCVSYCVPGALSVSPEATWPKAVRDAHFALLARRESVS